MVQLTASPTSKQPASNITAADFSLPHGVAYDGDATAFPRVAR
jgi:hypothetical protein